MIGVYYDDVSNAIWISYRTEPFMPGTLQASADGDTVTVAPRGNGIALLTVPYTQISDRTGVTQFASVNDCVGYLNGEFIKRRLIAAQFTQATPVLVWTITHGLSFPPKALVIDTAGDPVLTDTRYPAPGIVELRFGAPTAGIAYLT